MPGERKRGVEWPKKTIELRYLKIQISTVLFSEDKHV